MSGFQRSFSDPMQSLLKTIATGSPDVESIHIALAEPQDPPSSLPPATSFGISMKQNAPRKGKFYMLSANAGQLSWNKPGPAAPQEETRTTPSLHATDQQDHELKSSSTQTPTARKTAKLATNMAERIGGEDRLQELLQQLEKERLWSGSFASERNMRLVRKFLGVPKQKGDENKPGHQHFIRLNSSDIAWWVKHGPLITTLTSGGSNRKFAAKAAQFEFFVDAVLRDRKDRNSVDEYEATAARMNMNAFSGQLVEQIVREACKLQNQSYPPTKVHTKGGEDVKPLSTESLRTARINVMGQALGLPTPVTQNRITFPIAKATSATTTQKQFRISPPTARKASSEKQTLRKRKDREDTDEDMEF